MDVSGRSTSQNPALGARAARLVGLIFTISTVLNLVVPNGARLDRYAAVGVVLVGVALAFVQLGRSHALRWAVLVYLLSLAAMVTFLLPGSEVDDVSTLAVVTNIATVIIPSLCLLTADAPWLRLLVLPAFVPVLVLAIVAGWPSGRAVFIVITLGCYWSVFALMAMWLADSVGRAAVGLERLARAHDVERQASDDEAQRRYGARLLHDTVLATLTLIAHSGAGVDPHDLRQRARADAALLRGLRTGSDAGPGIAPADPPPPDPAHAGGSGRLAWPLRTLDRRSDQGGVRVLWHGDQQVDLTSATAGVLLRAVAECLENVRRHAGVSEVDVTFTQYGATLQATVTDLGVGFDPTAVAVGRFGLAHSVRARLREVDGASQVFSSPGGGTTVLLEVPR